MAALQGFTPLSLVAVSVYFFASSIFPASCTQTAAPHRHLVPDGGLRTAGALSYPRLPIQRPSRAFQSPRVGEIEWRGDNASASFKAVSSLLSAYLADSLPSNPDEAGVLQTLRSVETILLNSTSRVTTTGILSKLDGSTNSTFSLQAPPVDELRKNFPVCALDCLNDWPGDKWCDKECFSLECGMDGGDCADWCTPFCQLSWIGDNQCDKTCYSDKCNWDGEDCKEFQEKVFGDISKNQTEAFDYRQCACNHTLLGNGVCDPACNTVECRFDGLDCSEKCVDSCLVTWLGDGMCDQECDNSECHFDKGDCKGCGKESKCRPWMVGNQICDPACNESDCNFDDGDCLGILAVVQVNYTAPSPLTDFCAAEFVGDGFCDWQCYNEGGMWDGGDCDDSLPPMWLNGTVADSNRTAEEVRFLKQTSLAHQR